MSFPLYPEYKDSGVKWLGKIPAHWSVSQSRRLFVVRNESATPSDKQLTASQEHGVIYQEDFVRLEGRRVVEVIKGTDSLKHVEPNDFVISMRSFQGGIEWSKLRGSISWHYVMLVPVRNVHPPFFAHLFKNITYIQALRATTDLIRDGQELRYSHFVQVDLPLVSMEEQASIASFLDRETAKIDALVAEQQRLIELLKEKRQAIIAHAITKGLNPNASTKPSGVEWLGKVPTHWRVGKCGYYVTVLSGFAFPSADFSDNPSHHKLLRGINVGVGALRWDDVVYWKKSSNDGLDEYALCAGDLVLGMDRPLIAEGVRVAKVEAQDLPCLLLQRVALLRSRGEISVDYLKALFASPMFVAHFAPDTTGVSVPHISPEQIKSFVVPIPPLSEQDSIAAYIDETTTRSQALIAEAQRAIDLLQERRAALIAAAVTGQIDVRAIADRTAA
jgi:type I restriction enzyme S subunit